MFISNLPNQALKVIEFLKQALGKIYFLLVAVMALMSTPTAVAKPNLVLILADDLGYADVFANLPERLQKENQYRPIKQRTQSISQLASEGIRFTNAYATASTCAPSRAAIMTGRYQQRSGFWDTSDSRVGLHPSEVTLAEQLKKAGYVSGYFGKWHLGLSPLYNPRQRGFDYFYGFMGHGGHDYYDLTLDPEIPFYHNNILRNFRDIDQGKNNYLTDSITDEAVDFIRAQARKTVPFFAVVSFNAVHTPMQPPKTGAFATDSKEPRQQLLAMLGRMDLSVKKIISVLENTGVRENTLIVFMSDNGGAKSNASVNTPLSGFKSSYSEGGIRVPLFMSWPGELDSGVEFPEAVMGFDLFSTFIAAANAPKPQNRVIDGVDLLPYLPKKGKPAAKTGLVHQWLFWDRNDGGYAVRRKDFVLVKNKKDGQPSYFDLSQDIGQNNNLASQRRKAVRRFTDRYAEWRSQMNPAKQYSTDRVCRDPRFNDFSTNAQKRHAETKCKKPNFKVGCRDPQALNFDLSAYIDEPSVCQYQ